MMKLQRLLITKVFALLLTVLLVHGHTSWGSPISEESKDTDSFAAALKYYQKGKFKKAAAAIEQNPDLMNSTSPLIKAKVYLLLGACYEEPGKNEKAKKYYRALKKMLDDGLLDQVPVLAGVDTNTLLGYREVFEKSFFKFTQPVAASEMLKRNVVHAPQKSIEEKEKEKKKKKFPWLLALSGAIIVASVAVLLLAKKVPEKSFPKINWVKIPAGEFLMGDNFGEGEADESPLHEVYLDEYYISRYEISWGHYAVFLKETGRSDRLGGDYPANDMTWHDAVAFCEWLSQKTGENINLPTEAQWEKAARGNHLYRYPWGDSEPNCDLAEYYGCSVNPDGPGYYVRTGSMQAGGSPYGVYNMAANVSEWCRDWYDESYYSSSPKDNPAGPLQGKFRVIRGGDLSTKAFELRSANRRFKSPAYSSDYLGFRVVKEK